MLGVGIAAFRDVNSFFRYATTDDVGTVNPVASAVRWAVIRGVSQSGNFTRQYIYGGFNQDESDRIVHEGAWPIIAGRRVAANVRWSQPDACSKVIEHVGGSEVFALKMTMEWVGTSANADIPLPRNARRYYIPSTMHGGGGGFNANIPNNPVNCPGNNWGQGIFRANPVSETEITNVARVDTDGNEVGGVPTVLRDAPLGTDLGWNITAAGFHAGQVCNYVGGMIAFATTQAQRAVSGDPRLSLQERYGSHDGYVSAVRSAADNAMSQGYLLQADHDALIQAAQASNVLQ